MKNNLMKIVSVLIVLTLNFLSFNSYYHHHKHQQTKCQHSHCHVDKTEKNAVQYFNIINVVNTNCSICHFLSEFHNHFILTSIIKFNNDFFHNNRNQSQIENYSFSEIILFNKSPPYLI